MFYFLPGLFSSFFFKQKSKYEVRISDWSSDVCSSDLADTRKLLVFLEKLGRAKGFEPSTPTLARLCSTPELRPLWRLATGGCQRVRRAISTGFGSRQAPMMLFARARASGLASAVQIPHKQFPPLRSRRHAVATLGMNPQEKEAVEALRRDGVGPALTRPGIRTE